MQIFKMPEREQFSNKGTFGKVLNFAGSKNYIGAAYLSTIAILKAGAGFAALASEKNIISTVAAQLPEAVYLSRADGLKSLRDFSVILIGCGLGTQTKSRIFFKSALNEILKNSKPAVIDADGLNILACMKPVQMKEIVITPHPLEAARLLGVKLDDVLNNLEDTAKGLAEKYGCTAVLKTHRTIVVQGDNYYINQHGNSALAKAGSGDVLAGIIAGLMAQKMKPFEAAKLGVYLHSRAGEIASERLTEYAVLASELIKFFPEAVKELI